MSRVSPIRQSTNPSEPVSIEESQETSTLIKIIAVVKNMLDIINDSSRQTQGNINEMKEKLEKLTEDQVGAKKWLGLISVVSSTLTVVATFVCVAKGIPPEVGSALTNALHKAVSTHLELSDLSAGAKKDILLRLFDSKTSDKNNTSGLTREYKDSGKDVGNLYPNAAHA